MSRNIDLTKPLSDEDRAYLEERGSYGDLRTADEYARARGEDVSGTSEMELTESQKAERENLRVDPKADATGEVVESDEGAYADMTKPELENQLGARGLSRSGNKDELVARLIESDSAE